MLKATVLYAWRSVSFRGRFRVFHGSFRVRHGVLGRLGFSSLGYCQLQLLNSGLLFTGLPMFFYL